MKEFFNPFISGSDGGGEGGTVDAYTKAQTDAMLDKKMDSSMRNSADGVAGLDGDSKINISQIPTTDEYNVESTYPVTSKAVEAAMNTLPNPMLYKGSLGTGGTITALPTASASNEGFTYKVITSGTYAGQSAKVGDVFISNGAEWTIIPSGDEPEGTVISVGMSVPTGLKIKEGTSPVTTSGTIEVQLDEGYVIPKVADIVPSTRKINNITLESDVVLDGDDIKATGYVKAESKLNITGTDTINQALGKLELKSDTNETNISNANTQIVDIYNRCGGGKNLCPVASAKVESESGGFAIGNNTTKQKIDIKAGRIIVSWSGTATVGRSEINFFAGEKKVTAVTITNATSVAFEVELDSDVDGMHLYCSKACVFSNMMIRYADVKDDTYVPYIPTNAELQEQINALTARCEALESAATSTTSGTE